MNSAIDHRGETKYFPDKLLQRHFWSDVFLNFFVVYQGILVIGTVLLILCFGVLYIQEHYPSNTENFHKEKNIEKNDKDLAADKNPDASGEEKNTKESAGKTDGSDSKYQKVYQGEKGVSEEKAKKLVKKYLCYSWDSGMSITPETIQIESIVYPYRIVHVRKKNKNTIVAYFEVTSGKQEGTLLKFKSQKKGEQNYSMKTWKVN